MTRARKWFVGLGLGFGVLLILGFVAASLIPSDDELAQNVATELKAELGVHVSVGALRWQLLPLPAVVIEDTVIAQAQPITVKKLTVYPDAAALWQRRLKINRAELDGAVVPQLSLRGLASHPAEGRQRGGFVADDLPLARFVFRNVTWITRRGIPVIFDGEVDFDAGWRPRTATLLRPGVQPATDLTLTRQGQDDRWTVRVNLGGGTAHGQVQLQTQPNGRMNLVGKLQPHEIEVANALTAFNRRPVLAGKASGDTKLAANGVTPWELAQTLHTKTTFAMGHSTLLRIDLGKAIRSAGSDHAGQTPLDAVTGEMDTQNTPRGMVVDFRDIKARSGALSASGKATLANRQVDADFAVDLVDGVVGVPLKVSGPMGNVKVSVSSGAVAGAVVGSTVLPGIGTAIGARVGAALGKIFGSGPERKNGPQQ